MVSLHNNNSFGIDTERCFFFKNDRLPPKLLLFKGRRVYEIIADEIINIWKYITFDIHAKPTLAARDD